ncbi:MAG: DegT/DnrJ/EryC1/StrS family aminotransferase [Bacteroidales bacterium]|nr:DegT/DnrJ/EryC1/StrS family aminotransferase [Bacteroidales bacterium]
MQFRDLRRQYEALKPFIDSAMHETVQSSAFIMGQPVKRLEEALAEYVGVKHCITCASGTDALDIALKVWKIGPGDAVFVPDFTFFASAEVVALEGAEPVFVDVDTDTFNMSATSLEAAIESVLHEGRLTPRAVIAVDLFGLPADYRTIRPLAQKYGLYLLEDAAQGFGGRLQGRRACSFGDIGATSFFPAKPLGCYGDGGAIFTDNDEWATVADSIRVHGKGSFKYDNVRIGLNSRLDTLQAAVLLPKFDAFKRYELEQVNRCAAAYQARLADVLKTPDVPQGFFSSWAQYTVQLPGRAERDRLQAALKEQQIPSMVYYPKPMHLQTAFQSLLPGILPCPVAERLCDTVLSLPMHPYLTIEEIDEVCDVVRRTLAS